MAVICPFSLPMSSSFRAGSSFFELRYNKKMSDNFEIPRERDRNPRPNPEKITPLRKPKDISKIIKDRGFTWDDGIAFHGGPRRSPREIVAWSMAASLIDFLLLIALNCLLVMVTIAITHDNPFRSEPLTLQNAFVWIVGGQILLTSWCYMVLLRSFLGYSTGEWACHLRLGDDFDFSRSNYTLRVIVRCSIILATGLIALPLLSALTGKDWAGQISGLKLKTLI